jgi:hypothetical protein
VIISNDDDDDVITKMSCVSDHDDNNARSNPKLVGIEEFLLEQKTVG